MIKLVVFDMAGTTVQDHHEVERCFAEAAKVTGLTVSAERILALQGYSKIEVFNLLWREVEPNLSTVDCAIKVQNSYNIFCQILENHYLTNGAKPTVGCLEIFEYLKEKNIKIALTTGFYRKVTNIILEKLGWLIDSNDSSNNTIDVSIASDEVEKGRPNPDMILKAMHLMKITDPRQVINIGDTPSDLISGKEAGCLRAYGITNGTHSEEALQEYPNDGLFSSLTDFKCKIDYLLEQNI